MAVVNNGDAGSVARAKINALIALPLEAVSANKTLDAGDMQTRQRVTTGSSDVTITMPSASSHTGEMVWIEKVDSGTGKVIVGSTLAHLYAQNDRVTLQSNGTTWDVINWKIAPLVQTYDATATWSKPPLATRAYVQMVGAGGGGCAGERNTGYCVGGAGGGSGGYSEVMIAASALASSVTVTIGAGGAGGAGSATVGLFNAGANGGVTSFGAHLQLLGGEGGQTPYTSNRVAIGGDGQIWGCRGGELGRCPDYSGTNLSGALTYSIARMRGSPWAFAAGGMQNLVTGGGGSGGLSAPDHVGAGAASGGYGHGAEVAGGAGGALNTAGSAGTSQSLTGTFSGGGGGGGGGGYTLASSATGGFIGGEGGWPGGGGGGGGPGRNNSAGFLAATGGTGGNGGNGGVRVTTYF